MRLLVLLLLTLAGCGTKDPCDGVPCSPGRVCVATGSPISPKLQCSIPDAGQ
ncbi:MAG: hypothetical protein JNM17_19710 [Archangium sp.]|nr:hypothetical protein [Archangium sp.]